MGLSPQHKLRLRKLAGHSLAGWVALVGRTSRAVYEPNDAVARLEAAHPAILAMWHGQFMTIPALAPSQIPVRIMVARHADADILSHALVRFPHLGLIRGAGAGGRQRDRGGAQALRLALRALADGFSLAMTADVPPGPARAAGLGIITLARLAGRPIIPVAIASSRYKSLNTWSRLTINLPMSRLGVVVGEPIEVPRDTDEAGLEALRLRLEVAMNDVTARAYAIAGADPARATPPAADPAGAEAGPAAPGLRLKTYRRLTSLARPLIPALLRLRQRQGKEDTARLGERQGHASLPRPPGRLVWVHAASVGEANAVFPVIEALGARAADLRFLLTTGTRTSAELAGRRLGPNAVHQYLPIDAPAYVRRFLDHWRPDLGVLTESEIWPNLVLETAARHVPLALVNGRMSNRSFGRWRRNPGLSRPIFNRIAVVLAQNEKLARRFGELGARRCIAAGNLKIDAPPPPVDRSELDRLQLALGGRPRMVAASTHEGEEAVLAAAHRRLRSAMPGFCTILAPRHPERGLAVAEVMKGQGLSVALRSLGSLPGPDCDVYVADTIGELGTLYRVAPVAFVGGSLVERGGQNPIEAIRHEAAVLTGPHWENFPDAYQTLLRHKGAIEVHSAEDIAAAVLRLVADPAELMRMRAGAAATLASLSGALARTVETLFELLPEHVDLQHAT
jgi:3-deoxy-D-manno-octulosonic-acid transferase